MMFDDKTNRIFQSEYTWYNLRTKRLTPALRFGMRLRNGGALLGCVMMCMPCSKLGEA